MQQFLTKLWVVGTLIAAILQPYVPPGSQAFTYMISLWLVLSVTAVCIFND